MATDEVRGTIGDDCDTAENQDPREGAKMEVIGFQLDDVLDLAIRMETNGAEFYELAARSTP
jgi:hypothetical protein